MKKELSAGTTDEQRGTAEFIPSASLAQNGMLSAASTRKEQILEYLKNKKPDYRFTWAGNQKWVAVYETAHSLSDKLNIPISSVRKSLKDLFGTKGFSFTHKLVSYEYRVDL